jgi:hypothetical protein
MQYDLKPTPWAMMKRAQFNKEHSNERRKRKSEHSILEEWELVNTFIEKKKYNQLYIAVKYGLDTFFDLWTKFDDIETNTELFKEILESTLQYDEIDFYMESSIYMKIISMKYSNFIYTNVEDLRDSNFRSFFDYDTSIYIPPFYKNFVLKQFFSSEVSIHEYEAPELLQENLTFLKDFNISRKYHENYHITKIVKENLQRKETDLDDMIDNKCCIIENYSLN